MSYSLKQTRRFARAYKKLHDNVAADVDVAIAEFSRRKRKFGGL